MSKLKFIFLFISFVVWGYCSIKKTMLVETGGGIMEGYLLIFFQCLIELISICCVLKNINLIVKSSICKWILLWLYYAFVITVLNSTTLFHSLRDMMWWPLVFLLFYIYPIKGRIEIINKVLIRYIVPTVIILNVLVFLSLRSVSFENVIDGSEGFASSNPIFFVATLLPLCFLYKNKIIKYTLLLLIIVSIILSFKRSALIYAAMALAVALYFDFIKRDRVNLLFRVLLPTFIVVVFYFIYSSIEEFTGGHLTERIEAMQSDGGSGRLTIYERMINCYENELTFVEQCIGIGFDNAKNMYLRYHNDLLSAHNDLLEMLIDFGIIGLVVYLVIIFKIYKIVRQSKNIGFNYYQANIVAFGVFIVMSMVSHLFIYPTYYAYLLLLWGITAGALQKIKNTKQVLP